MVYKWYILPIGGLYATYHLLREPETTIETVTNLDVRQYKWYGQCASRDCEPLEEFAWVFASFSVAICGVLLWNSPFFLAGAQDSRPSRSRALYVYNMHKRTL